MKEERPKRALEYIIKRDDYSQLRAVLPPNSEKNYFSPIDVIEGAIEYIAHLQATLQQHENTSLSTVHVQRESHDGSRRTQRNKKVRKIASFHNKLKCTPRPRKMKGQAKPHKRRNQNG
ncbi:uncharacterized protein LOC124453303 [Xenia sp. Carnegie-2017]|uniref:uncharacterized protein LOC124453303 n=1 Tax=Xenia sp. Carnegie-2017 TaxID=2897299 RepID=UPI001F04F582|nr:uncharacterized protein LOC124453303 [Xenia sp. Carnegie-2017]